MKHFDYIIGPPILALLWLLLSWSYARSINRGRALTPTQRKMTTYGLLFVLGMGYAMAVAALLHWGGKVGLTLTGVWAVLLGLSAWVRHRRVKGTLGPPRKPLSQSLAEGLPAAGLLVCLVVSVVEWSLWARGKTHLLVALLWTAGIGGIIALARSSRRATVVMALRAFLGLSVIGAVTRASLAALAIAGAAAVILFVLDRLWKKEPPMMGLKSLASEPTRPTEPHSGEPLR